MAPLTAVVAPRKLYRLNRSICPTTIVYGCIDPWRVNALLIFLHEELGLEDGEFILMLNPGGIMSLCPHGLASEYFHILELSEFCFKKFSSIRTAVGINHDNCGGYEHVIEKHGPRFLRGMSVGALQMRHLANEWVPHVRLAAQVRPADAEDLRFRAFHMHDSEKDPEAVFFTEVQIG